MTNKDPSISLSVKPTCVGVAVNNTQPHRVTFKSAQGTLKFIANFSLYKHGSSKYHQGQDTSFGSKHCQVEFVSDTPSD